VFFGSSADRDMSSQAEAERTAAPWVECVDYEEAGFVAVRPELSALGLALWGTREFRVARPWVEADYRVHVTRGCSTHLFAFCSRAASTPSSKGRADCWA
jgi:hypothetical protein